MDKPYGVSSNKVLQQVRRALGNIKAGHAGTLDPLATGVLPIALGEATKLISFCMNDLKTYVFTVTWGEETSTDDQEGEVVKCTSFIPSFSQITAVLKFFRGEIQQIPPSYSALKIAGKRAYDLSRQGKKVDLKPRSVFIKNLQILRHFQKENKFSTEFEMVCGKGTYVRSVARDMGKMLESAGYVSSLRRTRVGRFGEEETVSLEKVLEIEVHSTLQEKIHSSDVVLDDIPVVTLNPLEIGRICQGQRLAYSQLTLNNPEESSLMGLFVRCYDQQGQFYLIGRVENGVLSPHRRLNVQN